MILEFNKVKQLLTPWGISTYGQKVDLQLEFDLPACACYQAINNITLNIYKKGNTAKPLVTSNNFTMSDATTWQGSIQFIGPELLAYLQSVADTSVILDGRFSFQISDNKTVDSQVFFIKLYDCPGPLPPPTEFPTREEMNKAITDSISTHNTDLQAHKDLLAKYATIEYVNSLIVGVKVNNISILTKDSLLNHYTYNQALNTWEFDITNDGQAIRINSIALDIQSLNLVFNKLIDGKEIEVYIIKNGPLEVNYYFHNQKFSILTDTEMPNGEYIFNFSSINGEAKFIKAFKI